MGPETPSFVLAALVASGGIFGYIRTRSLPSIIAGVSVGLLYALGGYRTGNGDQYGTEISLLASIILGGSSIPRALRLRKTVPAILSVIATFGMVLFGQRAYQGR